MDTREPLGSLVVGVVAAVTDMETAAETVAAAKPAKKERSKEKQKHMELGQDEEERRRGQWGKRRRKKRRSGSRLLHLTKDCNQTYFEQRLCSKITSSARERDRLHKQCRVLNSSE